MNSDGVERCFISAENGRMSRNSLTHISLLVDADSCFNARIHGKFEVLVIMKKTTMLEVHVADRDLHATQNLLYRMGVSFTRGSATELIVSHTERLRVESLLKGAFIPHVLQYRFRGCH